MKIVFLSSFCSPGNGSTFLLDLKKRYGDECALVTTDPYLYKKSFFERVADKLIKIFVDPFWPNLYRANHFRLLKAIEKEKPDVVHINWIHGHTIPLSVVRAVAKKYKTFWTFHDMFTLTGGKTYEEDNDGWRTGYINLPENNRSRREWQTKYDTLHGLPITIVAHSEWTKDKVLKSPIFKDNKVEIVYYGIDTDIFKPISAEEKENLRVHFQVPKDNLVISFISVSLNTPRKGYEHFRKALEYLDKDILSKICVILVGKEEKPVNPLPVHTIKAGHNLEQEMLCGIYNISYLYILPSEVESLSCTAIESSLCGTPVIGFNVGGIPTVVQNGENGFLVANAEEIAKKITYLIQNPELRQKMSEKAKRIAFEKFSRANLAKNLKKLYQHE